MNIKNNGLNILLLTILVVLFIYLLISYFIFDTGSPIINITITALVINIVFNIFIDMMFNKKKLRLLKKIGFINISLQQIKGLDKVKTIIFSKKGIISTGKYKLINVGHRSTANKNSVIEIATQLAKLWESPYFLTLQKKLKKEPANKEFSITQKLKEGISVTEENGKNLMLGTYSFVKEFVKKEDGSTLYLLKNNILIGKFTFKEKLNQKVIDSVKNLNQFGNLVYLDSKPEDKNSTNLPFDKGYTNLNINEQKSTILNLSSKAKTALFTTNYSLTGLADFDFLISESSNYQKNKKSIAITLEELNSIHKIFLLSKKVHTQLEYALVIFLLLNTAFVLYLLIRVLD